MYATMQGVGFPSSSDDSDEGASSDHLYLNFDAPSQSRTVANPAYSQGMGTSSSLGYLDVAPLPVETSNSNYLDIALLPVRSSVVINPTYTGPDINENGDLLGFEAELTGLDGFAEA